MTPALVVGQVVDYHNPSVDGRPGRIIQGEVEEVLADGSVAVRLTGLLGSPTVVTEAVHCVPRPSAAGKFNHD